MESNVTLQEVDLSHARLKTLPSILADLTDIKVLTLRQNLLRDVSQLLQLRTLTDLDLYDNELSAVPDISELKEITYVKKLLSKMLLTTYNGNVVIIYYYVMGT